MCNTRERDDGKAHIQGGRGIKEEQEVGVGRISETRQKPGTVERGRAFDLHHHDSSQHSLPTKKSSVPTTLSLNEFINQGRFLQLPTLGGEWRRMLQVHD